MGHLRKQPEGQILRADGARAQADWRRDRKLGVNGIPDGKVPRQAGWRRVMWGRFIDADPSVLGKSVRLSGRPYAIVGVMPISFRFPERDVDIWSPEVVNSPYTR